MNIQLAEKHLSTDGSVIEVHSVFQTIQGEGPFTGHAAVFVRLAGCNLQCPSCDTDYTSTRWRCTPFAILQLVSEMRVPSRLVVITGGEPFRQNIHPLVELLLSENYTVQIETNGTFAPPTPNFHIMCSTDTSEVNKCFIVCSPKTARINKDMEPLICAFKYVLASDNIDHRDGLPTSVLDHPVKYCVARPSGDFRGKVYVQPCDDKDGPSNKENLKACIRSVMKHGHVLQLQIHKLIDME